MAQFCKLVLALIRRDTYKSQQDPTGPNKNPPWRREDLKESVATMQNNPNILLLKYPDLVAAGIARSRTTITNWMRREHDPFPSPVRLGEGRFASIAWRAADVAAWLERRAAAGRSTGGR